MLPNLFIKEWSDSLSGNLPGLLYHRKYNLLGFRVRKACAVNAMQQARRETRFSQPHSQIDRDRLASRNGLGSGRLVLCHVNAMLDNLR